MSRPKTHVYIDEYAPGERGTGQWCPGAIDSIGQPDLLDWVTENADVARTLLSDRGAVRIRGMGGITTETFAAAVSLLAGAPLADYINRSTPRRTVADKVFTSTEYPADQWIPMHSEQSYATSWPTVIGFWGRTPAVSGGATPLAPTAQVLDRLTSSGIADRFRVHGVRYDRWYRLGLDLPWSEVFQTDDRQQVDRLCHEAGIETEWHDNGRVLHTSHTAQGTVVHHRSGREVWFNQANLFHLASLPEALAAVLRDAPPALVPRQVCLGNGERIEDSTIELINSAFVECCWADPWQPDDLLFVDNVAVAHGRQPYTGDRQVLVAMAGLGGRTDRFGR